MTASTAMLLAEQEMFCAPRGTWLCWAVVMAILHQTSMQHAVPAYLVLVQGVAQIESHLAWLGDLIFHQKVITAFGSTTSYKDHN